MMKVIVSGSRSMRRLPKEAEDALRRIMQLRYEVLVGDCDGIDLAVQRFFRENHSPQVTVFHIGPRPRQTVGFPTVAVRGTWQVEKDRRMCQEADYRLAIWDG